MDTWFEIYLCAPDKSVHMAYCEDSSCLESAPSLGICVSSVDRTDAVAPKYTRRARWVAAMCADDIDTSLLAY